MKVPAVSALGGQSRVENLLRAPADGDPIWAGIIGCIGPALSFGDEESRSAPRHGKGRLQLHADSIARSPNSDVAASGVIEG
jgi:hypothetical protein